MSETVSEAMQRINNPAGVKPGEVWASNDPRDSARPPIEVVSVEHNCVYVRPWGSSRKPMSVMASSFHRERMHKGKPRRTGYSPYTGD